MDAVSALNFILARVGKWVNYHIVFIPFHGKEKIQKRMSLNPKGLTDM